MKTKQNIFLRLFLLLLVTINISASENSWRLQNYNISTLCFMSLLLPFVSSYDKLISGVRAQCEQQQKEESTKLSQDQIEAEVQKMKYIIVGAGIILAGLALPPFLLESQDIYHYFFPTEEHIFNEKEAVKKIEYLQSRARLSKCFSKSNTELERGFVVSPTVCDDLVAKFVQCGGKDEEIAMINAYDKPCGE